MTIALARPRERGARHFDLSLPVLVLLALFLCGLVLLPLGWLAWYSITDKNGTPTFANFTRLASDPTFVAPYLTAAEIAAAVALAACAAALPLAWLVALFLCGLVLLPLGWLAWYSITDKNGTPTFANFTRLASDPTFVAPYLTAAEIAAAVALAACAAALPVAWLVA